MFFEKIHPFYFFLAFAIGLFYCYITTPKPELIIKFPSPFNAGKIVYHDQADTCYKYKADKVDCPTDKKLIRDQPIQEDFYNKK
jgi:hypothetical protein